MSEVSIYAKNGHRPSGTIVLTDPYGTQEYHTAVCCHCGFHWQVKPGSGNTRGWCHGCQGLTCGKKVCNKYHFPMEAQIETVEALGRHNMRAAAKLLQRYGKGIIIGNI